MDERTLITLLLVNKCFSLSQKCDKKSLKIPFFSLPTVCFLPFFPKWVHKRYATITYAPKAHLKQLKDYEAIFLKNGNFGNHENRCVF